MEKATATSSTDQRQSYWNQAMDVVADEVPIYGLFHRNISTAVRQGSFSKVSPIGTTGLYLLNSKIG